jgi:hypothetical protein
MTCIVAALDNHGKIIMGADSSAVDETIHTPHIDPKVFVKGEFGIGYCHSFRMGQILQFWFTPPEIPENEKDMMRYMVMDFIPELKGVLADQDYPFHDDEKIDWSIIVAVRGKLFTIEADWHVGHDGIPYAAIGAGSPYALGAMHSIHGEPNASIVALKALETAEKFSPYVLGPFNFIEV